MAEYRLSPAAERDLEGIWIYTRKEWGLEQAERDLEGIWIYTRKEWGLEQAERYIDLLTAAFEVLAESPKLAPACDHVRHGYRRRNVERHMISSHLQLSRPCRRRHRPPASHLHVVCSDRKVIGLLRKNGCSPAANLRPARISPGARRSCRTRSALGCGFARTGGAALYFLGGVLQAGR